MRFIQQKIINRTQRNSSFIHLLLYELLGMNLANQFNRAGSFHHFRGPPPSRREVNGYSVIHSLHSVYYSILYFCIAKRNILFESICTLNRVFANFFNKIFLFVFYRLILSNIRWICEGVCTHHFAFLREEGGPRKWWKEPAQLYLITLFSKNNKTQLNEHTSICLQIIKRRNSLYSVI